MQLEVTRFIKGQKVYEGFLKVWFEACLNNLDKEKELRNIHKLRSMELSLVFVSEAKIKKLNKDYRGINRATDVLSFDGDGYVSMGELIFCMDVIKIKAESTRLPSRLYLGMLMLHGMLHLLGYEHEQGGPEEVEMLGLQDKIMRKVASKLAPNHKRDFDVGQSK